MRRIYAGCEPLPIVAVVDCRRLSWSAGNAPAKARQHRWGDAVPASRSDGAWQCGAGIPVCPRRPAQTGMSAPHWAASVDGHRYPSPPVDTRRYPPAVPAGSAVPAVPGLEDEDEDEDEDEMSHPSAPLLLMTRCGDKVWETRCGRQGVARSTHSKPTLKLALKLTLNRYTYSTRLIFRLRQSCRHGSRQSW